MLFISSFLYPYEPQHNVFPIMSRELSEQRREKSNREAFTQLPLVG